MTAPMLLVRGTGYTLLMPGGTRHGYLEHALLGLFRWMADPTRARPYTGRLARRPLEPLGRAVDGTVPGTLRAATRADVEALELAGSRR